MKLKITVDGNVYEVEVEASEPEQPHPGYVPALGQAHAPSASPVALTPATAKHAPVVDESKVCRSPIAGVVVRVSAQVGQAIQVNDVLMVLEAMKMETSITSSISGTIARICVHSGDAVQSGQVLVEFS